MARDFEIESSEYVLFPYMRNIEDPGYPLEAILYQEGYLTIRREEDHALYIGFPNKAAREELIGLVLGRLTAGRIIRAEDFIDKYQKPVLKAFLNKDLPAMRAVLNAIIGECSIAFNAHVFRDVLQVSLNMLSLRELRFPAEENSATDRTGLTVECDAGRFVFELKAVTDREDAAFALQTAQKQLRSACAKDRGPLKPVPVAAAMVSKNKMNEENTASVLREIACLEEVDLNQPQPS